MLLELESVEKSWKGLRAVGGVSFGVEERAMVALIGPNGAGKTTVFNLIAGVYRPDRGAIRFAGAAIEGFTPERVCAAGIGRTFQIVKPFAGLSVLDNVIVGALHREPTLARARERARHTLEQLGLASKAQLPAAALGLPDRKRLEVARALATQPRLLLLDEVMAGLRPTEVDTMVALLRQLNAQGLTILLIEHVMRAVMSLAQHVVVLNHGEIIAHGTPEHVVRDEAVLASYLGTEALG